MHLAHLAAKGTALTLTLGPALTIGLTLGRGTNPSFNPRPQIELGLVPGPGGLRAAYSRYVVLFAGVAIVTMSNIGGRVYVRVRVIFSITWPRTDTVTYV